MMIRDVCFNENCALPVSCDSWPHTPQHLLVGDVVGDGVDETLLSDRFGNIVIYKVSDT